MLAIPDPDLRALASGESVIAFVPRATLTEGDEVTLEASGPRAADELKPAYRRWAKAGPTDGSWAAIVVSVHPAASLDVAAGADRHILAEPGEGDLVILQVFNGTEAVLSEDAFLARRSSVEGAIAP
jgi:hypothetical protein